ncbi:hypothetical protein KSZ_71870 [Dictyobacter formicarum]|uniref:Uncharacterized protein n=1 Tax=Dictyobacter formicarum TaxID=2778368 RepID=A0ABQ3VTW8_9CHLR|nr:hypothetical protein KSZ_71870 [Dictyobacter formicarum]
MQEWCYVDVDSDGPIERSERSDDYMQREQILEYGGVVRRAQDEGLALLCSELAREEDSTSCGGGLPVRGGRARSLG